MYCLWSFDFVYDNQSGVRSSILLEDKKINNKKMYRLPRLKTFFYKYMFLMFWFCKENLKCVNLFVSEGNSLGRWWGECV